MGSYKEKKIMIISSEQLKNSNNKYLISSDSAMRGKEKYFYQQEFMIYKELSTSQYIIYAESNSWYLEITDTEVIDKMLRFQICFEVTTESGEYNPDGILVDDIITLRENYNKLQNDLVKLWENVSNSSMKADNKDMSLILPQLKDNEVWVKKGDGWEGYPLANVNDLIQETIDDFSRNLVGIDENGNPLVPYRGILKSVDDFIKEDMLFDGWSVSVEV